MNDRSRVIAFLGRHGFEVGSPPVNTVINALLYDMEAGLNEEPGPIDSMSPSQDMIPTWNLPPKNAPKNKSVIVIDAGGTNFRSCLVTFDDKGIPSISKMEKQSMPGIDRELSKKEFFDTIAKYLDHLKDESPRIGFCFSYAMKITRDGDGQVLLFSKEIKAREVINSLVGESLSAALVERGWTKPKKIILLNDTMAALLAGAAAATEGRNYSSYAGFILGTGMNAAYIEANPVPKTGADGASWGEQIIVCESGKFNKIQRSSFDTEFDKTTNSPGLYVYEKMCSGAYLGHVIHLALKKAANDNLFSPDVGKALITMDALELKDVDMFLYGPYRTNTLLGGIAAQGIQSDYDILFMILDSFIERAARFAAANIAAVVIRSGKGTQASLPVCIMCEGTTFLKTHNFQARVKGYLNQVLTDERGLYFEIVSMDNAITLGAAIAGLTE